jgi:hypothetical protein
MAKPGGSNIRLTNLMRGPSVAHPVEMILGPPSIQPCQMAVERRTLPVMLSRPTPSQGRDGARLSALPLQDCDLCSYHAAKGASR